MHIKKSVFAEVVAKNQIRITVLGDTNVGKTAMIQLFAGGSLPLQLFPSCGIDVGTKTVEIFNQVYRIGVWDTPGTTRYHSISLSYIFPRPGIVLVYDISDRNSFNSISSWLQAVRQKSQECKILLLGNKCDLRNGDRCHRMVSTQEGKQFADKNGLLFAEVSVTERKDTVIKAFQSLLESIVKFAEEEEERKRKLLAINSTPAERGSIPDPPASGPPNRRLSFDVFRDFWNGAPRSVSVS